MSYQEKKVFVSIISSILIFTLYTLYAIKNAEEGSITSASDFSFWGSFILVLLPVSIVAKVIIHIVFVIFNKIATNEDEPSFEDEFDKIIELKADRISLYVFFLGFILSMVPLLTDLPTYFIKKEFNMGKDAISNHIRNLRFHHNEMTQQQLADKAGVTRQTIVAIEKGNYSPSLELAFRIARVFGKSIEEVFQYDDKQ